MVEYIHKNVEIPRHILNYPLKYDGNFCPAIGITGVMSVI
jgi:hypothetical protein